MNQDPSIDDGMTANGYVRCGGCGGFLPAGAICGLCLDRQKAMGPPAPRPKAPSKPVRPLKTAIFLGFCAVLVCGVGLAAVFAAKSVAGAVKGKAGSSPFAGLIQPEEGSATLGSGANQEVLNALSSGNSQQALSVLQASGSSAPSTLQSGGTVESAPVMQNSGSTPTPILESSKGGMPDNVRQWLEHLQRIEQTRIALAAAQIQESVKTLTGLKADDMTHAMDDEDNTDRAAEEKKQNARAQRVGGDMASMQTAWRTLLATFDSVQAPAECVGIKSNYDSVIGQTGVMIMDIVGQIKAASNDPGAAVQALTAMQGTSSGKIDVPARAADQGVNSVCKRYDTVKWFDIQSDVGSGAMARLGF
jgi:hypothetical protein